MIFNIEYETRKKNKSNPLKRKIIFNIKKLVSLTMLIITLITFGYTIGLNTGKNIIIKENLKKEVEKIDKRLEKVEELKNNEKEIIGFAGHMNISLINEQSKSSWELDYYLDYNICEINESYDWKQLGKYPYPGMFFKITNDFSDLSTWCMAIGTFNDFENKNRIVIISRKVSNDLGIQPDSFINIPPPYEKNF